MFRTKFAALVVSLVCLCMSSYAETVQVEGMGETFDAAEKDALAKATEKINGMYVVAQEVSTTDTEKGDSYQEKIVGNRDGRIVSHQIVKKSRENGLWHVWITAEVVRNEDAGKIQKKTSGSFSRTGLLELGRKTKVAEDAIQSLDMLLKNFPNNVLHIELYGEPELYGRGAIKIQIQCSVNRPAYTKVIGQVKNLLDIVALRKTQTSTGQGSEKVRAFIDARQDAVIVSFGKEGKELVFNGYMLTPLLQSMLHEKMRVFRPQLSVEYLDSAGHVTFRENFDIEREQILTSRTFVPDRWEQTFQADVVVLPRFGKEEQLHLSLISRIPLKTMEKAATCRFAIYGIGDKRLEIPSEKPPQQQNRVKVDSTGRRKPSFSGRR